MNFFKADIEPFINLGDTIAFKTANGLQMTGKISLIMTTLKKIKVYVVDNTGGSEYIIDMDDVISIVSFNKKSEDSLEKPLRYTSKGKLECWDVIIDQKMNFLEGNIIKYVWRYKSKNGVEDLKKARVYLDKLISELEK